MGGGEPPWLHLPERLNRSSLIGLCSHTFSVKFSAGWDWKAFADSQGSLSAYLLSKSVAAPELKQSEKTNKQKKTIEKALVLGNLVFRAMAQLYSSRCLDLNINHLLPNWLKNGLPAYCAIVPTCGAKHYQELKLKQNQPTNKSPQINPNKTPNKATVPRRPGQTSDREESCPLSTETECSTREISSL